MYVAENTSRPSDDVGMKCKKNSKKKKRKTVCKSNCNLDNIHNICNDEIDCNQTDNCARTVSVDKSLGENRILNLPKDKTKKKKKEKKKKRKRNINIYNEKGINTDPENIMNILMTQNTHANVIKCGTIEDSISYRDDTNVIRKKKKKKKKRKDDDMVSDINIIDENKTSFKHIQCDILNAKSKTDKNIKGNKHASFQHDDSSIDKNVKLKSNVSYSRQNDEVLGNKHSTIENKGTFINISDNNMNQITDKMDAKNNRNTIKNNESNGERTERAILINSDSNEECMMKEIKKRKKRKKNINSSINEDCQKKKPKISHYCDSSPMNFSTEKLDLGKALVCDNIGNNCHLKKLKKSSKENITKVTNTSKCAEIKNKNKMKGIESFNMLEMDNDNAENIKVVQKESFQMKKSVEEGEVDDCVGKSDNDVEITSSGMKDKGNNVSGMAVDDSIGNSDIDVEITSSGMKDNGNNKIQSIIKRRKLHGVTMFVAENTIQTSDDIGMKIKKKSKKKKRKTVCESDSNLDNIQNKRTNEVDFSQTDNCATTVSFGISLRENRILNLPEKKKKKKKKKKRINIENMNTLVTQNTQVDVIKCGTIGDSISYREDVNVIKKRKKKKKRKNDDIISGTNIIEENGTSFKHAKSKTDKNIKRNDHTRFQDDYSGIDKNVKLKSSVSYSSNNDEVMDNRHSAIEHNVKQITDKTDAKNSRNTINNNKNNGKRTEHVNLMTSGFNEENVNVTKKVKKKKKRRKNTNSSTTEDCQKKKQKMSCDSLAMNFSAENIGSSGTFVCDNIGNNYHHKKLKRNKEDIPKVTNTSKSAEIMSKNKINGIESFNVFKKSNDSTENIKTLQKESCKTKKTIEVLSTTDDHCDGTSGKSGTSGNDIEITSSGVGDKGINGQQKDWFSPLHHVSGGTSYHRLQLLKEKGIVHKTG